MAKKKKKQTNEILEEAEAAKKAKKKAKKAERKKARKVRVAERIDDPEDGEAESDSKSSREKLDEGMEAIGKLVDHPLVADIVAAGAVAAVASLAEKQVTRARGASGGSKETLKFAGKAAAAAMGKRFMAEMEAAKARREADEDGSGSEEE